MKCTRENENHAVTAWNFDTFVISFRKCNIRNTTSYNLSYVGNIEALT